MERMVSPVCGLSVAGRALRLLFTRVEPLFVRGKRVLFSSMQVWSRARAPLEKPAGSTCSNSSHCSCPMRKSALLARRAPSAAQSTPSLPKSEPEQPVSSERWAHETIYMNPRKKKDGSRDGFLVFTSGKKVVLHSDGGT